MDTYLIQARADLRAWARQNLSAAPGIAPEMVDLIRPIETAADIVATLLYPVTGSSVFLLRAAPVWGGPFRFGAR